MSMIMSMSGCQVQKIKYIRHEVGDDDPDA